MIKTNYLNTLKIGELLFDLLSFTNSAFNMIFIILFCNYLILIYLYFLFIKQINYVLPLSSLIC